MSKSKDAPSESAAVAELRPFEEWAAAKGHVPSKAASKFRGDFHRGPHIDVVFSRARLAHGLARNSPITEEAYDKIVEEAYSLPIGET